MLGPFEERVLLAVAQEGEQSYGVTIRRAVGAATGKDPAIGAIYTTLNRLEEKGFVSSREGESLATRGGRSRRYYRIEGAGVEALRQAEQERAQLRPAWQPGFQMAEVLG
jgi:DNA-binding PadR family transcriptional regulator